MLVEFLFGPPSLSLEQGFIGIHIVLKEMRRWVRDILISSLEPWIPRSLNINISICAGVISFLRSGHLYLSDLTMQHFPRSRNRKARSIGCEPNWKTPNRKMRIFRWTFITFGSFHRNWCLASRRSSTRSSKPCPAVTPRETSTPERWTNSGKSLRECRWKGKAISNQCLDSPSGCCG